MIISSEIKNVEKVENLIKVSGKSQKSTLRAFARTRAKKVEITYGNSVVTLSILIHFGQM